MSGQDVRKRSVTIAGHRTSVTLEAAFWDSLKDIAAIHGKSVNTLIAELDRAQPHNLSSAIRVFVLAHYKGAAPDAAAGALNTLSPTKAL